MSAIKQELPATTNGSATVRAVYNIGSAERIPPGEGRVYHVANTTIAVFRSRDGQVYATQPQCPHRGGPLIDGLVGPAKVICPLHNFAFHLATGQPIENACDNLRIYPTSLNEAGEILLTIES
jgi:nitrite reductase [NAD(P)H] small subunit